MRILATIFIVFAYCSFSHACFAEVEGSKDPFVRGLIVKNSYVQKIEKAETEEHIVYTISEGFSKEVKISDLKIKIIIITLVEVGIKRLNIVPSEYKFKNEKRELEIKVKKPKRGLYLCSIKAEVDNNDFFHTFSLD